MKPGSQTTGNWRAQGMTLMGDAPADDENGHFLNFFPEALITP
jgi:hypothetical protein